MKNLFLVLAFAVCGTVQAQKVLKETRTVIKTKTIQETTTYYYEIPEPVLYAVQLVALDDTTFTPLPTEMTTNLFTVGDTVIFCIRVTVGENGHFSSQQKSIERYDYIDRIRLDSALKKDLIRMKVSAVTIIKQ